MSRETPSNIRQLIIEKHNDHLSQVVISQHLNVPRSTVSDIIRRYRETGSSDRFSRSGRQAALTVKTTRRLARASQKNPRATASELSQEVLGATPPVCTRTVQRYLQRGGRQTYRPAKSPLLTVKRMRARLAWAREHRHWTTDDWRKVNDSYNRS